MTDTPDTNWVINATDDDFEKEVIERSKQTLCVVDFWAEWCAPCRTLGPILEELTTEYQGAFTLVKIDTEKAQQTATSFGIQSIPAVFAVLDGEPIDGFNGVMPKEQIKEWIDKLLEQNEFVNAKNIMDSDPSSAESKLKFLLEANPSDARIEIALADLYLRQDREDECSQILAKLEERGFLEPEAEKIKATLDLKCKSDVDIDEVKAKAEASPNDLELQLELADGYVGKQQFETAFEICLEIVRQDKKGVGDKARQLMVDVFRTLPADSDLTSEYRRKLSTALY